MQSLCMSNYVFKNLISTILVIFSVMSTIDELRLKTIRLVKGDITERIVDVISILLILT